MKTAVVRGRIFVDGVDATGELVAGCWFDPPGPNKLGRWGGRFQLRSHPTRGLLVPQCELRLNDGTSGTIVVSKLVNFRDGIFIGSGDPPPAIANGQ